MSRPRLRPVLWARWRADVPPRRPRLDLERIDRNSPSRSAFWVWTAFLLIPAVRLGEAPRALWLTVPSLLLLAVLYTAVVITVFDGRRPLRVPLALLAGMAAATAATTFAFGQGWYSVFPLLGVAAGVVAGQVTTKFDGLDLPLLTLVGGPTMLSIVVPWLAGAPGGSIFGWSSGTASAVLVTAVILRLFVVIGLLGEAREELAHAAVARERLRFSRDLHDLLGHTLSIMVVKAQAVRRIAERDPTVAIAQAVDIENIGRDALTEVRQAVTGYRGRGLSAELDAACIALSDAEIEFIVRRRCPPLPPEPDALLGWAVREGVTNVIRHSGAHTCDITLRRQGDDAVLEIRDDGRPELPPRPGGHGLNGLRERISVARGTVEAGRSPGGGFTVTVTVPLTTREWDS
ncbi:sensor histidine kinase [Nocardia sp. NPDC050175]|uniref:sensor histidine kinase n=1 Tax=Nocardia sp. NPDC050175 TaxID=3364317 RepID=UPI0037A58178